MHRRVRRPGILRHPGNVGVEVRSHDRAYSSDFGLQVIRHGTIDKAEFAVRLREQDVRSAHQVVTHPPASGFQTRVKPQSRKSFSLTVANSVTPCWMGTSAARQS